MGEHDGASASLGLKILLILTMAVLTLFFGLLPIPVLKLLRKKSNERRSQTPNSSGEEQGGEDESDFGGLKWPSLTLCLLTCFSGGVFLATCFLDLLPGVIEKLEYIKAKTDWHLDYPLAELVTCSGFFLVFFLEEVVVLFYGGHGHSHGVMEPDSPVPGLVHVHDHKQRRDSSPTKNGSSSLQNGSKKRSGAPVRDKSGHYPLLVEEEDEDSSKSGKTQSSSTSAKKEPHVPGLTIVDDRENEETALDEPEVKIASKRNGVKKSPGNKSARNSRNSPNARRSGCTSGAMSLHSEEQKLSNAVPMSLFHDYSSPDDVTSPSRHHEYPNGLKLNHNGVSKGPTVKPKQSRNKKNRSHTVATGESLHLCDDRECLTTKARTYGSCSHIECTSNEIPQSLLDHKRSLDNDASLDLAKRKLTDCSVFTNVDLAEPERCEGPCDTDEDPPILMTSRPHAHSHGVRSLTLLLALSFHSVIEGMAFGIQESKKSLLVLFTSLIIHKMIVAFAVGLQFARTHAHQMKLVFLSILILAMVSPIGAAVGISVSEASIDSNSKEMVLMIFEGLAAGTFLYVTFFEILIHERDNEHPNLLKLLVLVLGFGLMAGLQTLEHDHGTGGLGTTVSPFNTTASPGHIHDHDHDHVH